VKRETESTEEWHKELVEKLASDALVERRRSRRWGIFFKLLTFAYLAVLLFTLLPKDWSEKAMGGKAHTALVELEGVISPTEKASADNVVTGLRDAFEDDNTKAVILRLREKYPDVPLYAVVTDICASGGYYVASAADEIYVNESSVIGSIGVLMNGFGFVDAMDELGIERRLMTAGDHKGILDPFSPLTEFDRQHAALLLGDLHKTFIEAVKTGRGDRLKGDDEQLFSGLFWSGEEGISLGLADAIGSAGYVAREVVGEEEIVDFTTKGDPLERLVNRFGAAIGKAIADVSGFAGGIQLR
jgi:protease-4